MSHRLKRSGEQLSTVYRCFLFTQSYPELRETTWSYEEQRYFTCA